MSDIIKISNYIKPFRKTIRIEGDKSLSIRWALMASQAKGKSTCYNLLKSEDIISTLNCLKKLGIKVKIKKDKWCKEIGSGRTNFQNENNLHIETYQENGFDYFYVPLTQISISFHCPVTFDESLSVLGNGIPCEIQPIK